MARLQFVYPLIEGNLTVVVVDPRSPDTSSTSIMATWSRERACSSRTRHSLAIGAAMRWGWMSRCYATI
ncbi:hypothetical protein ACFX1R_034776 [Malus domestica]